MHFECCLILMHTRHTYTTYTYIIHYTEIVYSYTYLWRVIKRIIIMLIHSKYLRERSSMAGIVSVKKNTNTKLNTTRRVGDVVVRI